MTDTLAELQRLATEAQDWSGIGTPRELRVWSEFRELANPAQILRLVRIAQAAEKLAAIGRPWRNPESDLAALREALGEKP